MLVVISSLEFQLWEPLSRFLHHNSFINHKQNNDWLWPYYLVELNALLSYSCRRILKTKDSQLSSHQVGGVLLLGGHVKHEPSEVRVEESGRNHIWNTNGFLVMKIEDIWLFNFVKYFQFPCAVIICTTCNPINHAFIFLPIKFLKFVSLSHWLPGLK